MWKIVANSINFKILANIEFGKILVLFAWKLSFISIILFAFYSTAIANAYKGYKKQLNNVLSYDHKKINEDNFRSSLGAMQFTEGAKDFLEGKSASQVDREDLYFATPSYDVLYDYLKFRLGYMLIRNEAHVPKPGGRGRLYAWSWGYWGRAAVNLYSASGQFRFLDLVTDTYKELLAQRDDRLNIVDDERKKVVPSWGTLFKDGTRANEVTTAGLITLPICNFLQVAERYPAIKERYSEILPKFREETLKTLSAFLDELRSVPGVRGGYFYHLTDDIVEPLNHSHVYGAALACCAEFENGDRYENTVKELAKFFRAAITKSVNGSYYWPYKPTPGNMHQKDKPEAFWKASVTIELPVAAFVNDIAFSEVDLRAFVKTLTENVHREKGGIAQFISPKRTKILDQDNFRGRKSLPAGIVAWLMLECVVPEVRDHVIDMLTENPKLFPNAWFGSNRKMLLALSLMLYHETKGGCQKFEHKSVLINQILLFD